MGFAVWFVFNSMRMSCYMSESVGLAVLLVHTINSVLLLAAFLFERRGRFVTIPLLSWFLIVMLVMMSSH